MLFARRILGWIGHELWILRCVCVYLDVESIYKHIFGYRLVLSIK